MPTETHGPTCIFRANLTPFSPQVSSHEGSPRPSEGFTTIDRDWDEPQASRPPHKDEMGKVDYIFVKYTGQLDGLPLPFTLTRDDRCAAVVAATHEPCDETGEWPSDHGAEAALLTVQMYYKSNPWTMSENDLAEKRRRDANITREKRDVYEKQMAMWKKKKDLQEAKAADKKKLTRGRTLARSATKGGLTVE